jgi:AcrR family transcriptional regulator
MAERKKAHRLRLLNAATRLFGRKGFHPTTVPMIVEESESSTGSFYFYFRNKGDIFESVLESIGERISDELNQAIAEQSDPFVQMIAAVERLVFFLAEHPEEARILIVESSGLGARLEEARRKIISSHARSVERALSHLAEELPPLKPSIVARCWVGAVYEAVYYWLKQPADERISAKSLAIEVAGFNLRGIGAPEEVL